MAGKKIIFSRNFLKQSDIFNFNYSFKLGTEITPLMKWAIWLLKQEFLVLFLFFLQQEVATEDMYEIFEK